MSFLKEIKHRDEKLRELARGQPCMVAKVGSPLISWIHPSDTCVWAHSNLYEHGKAARTKAHDCFGFIACYGCHCFIDQGKGIEREERRNLQRLAMAATRRYLMVMNMIAGATPECVHDDALWLDRWQRGEIWVPA